MERTHEILDEVVSGRRELLTDDDARQTLLVVIELTNFFNWRDKTYITDQLLVEPVIGSSLQVSSSDACGPQKQTGRNRFSSF